MVAVRILDCTGSGSISDTVAALDWVAANAKKPAVVTLSLGIQIGSWSRVLEEAVRSLVQNHGITVTVAAGNSQVDACYVAPANVPGEWRCFLKWGAPAAWRTGAGLSSWWT